jgi:D-glycero-alpha-D-manno-heptose 1-phosphate guanylyltransferase
MKVDVIILAGGLGTRLASVVSDVPKPMALVAGKPFLDHILCKLPLHNISQIILAVGYKYEKIEAYYGNTYHNIPIVYSVENEPLSTGGGVALALDKMRSETGIILNGDTFFDVNYEELIEVHKSSLSPITLSLKQMENPDRYGTVLVETHKIVRFQEKELGQKTGLINGGVYAIHKKLKEMMPHLDKFSFETEVLEANVAAGLLAGYISSGLFIDIGIPEDYERAQTIFAH